MTHPYGRTAPRLNHISERELFRGYSGLRDRTQVPDRIERGDAERVAHANGEPVPESLLLRGRRCPCGGGKT